MSAGRRTGPARLASFRGPERRRPRAPRAMRIWPGRDGPGARSDSLLLTIRVRSPDRAGPEAFDLLVLDRVHQNTHTADDALHMVAGAHPQRRPPARTNAAG